MFEQLRRPTELRDRGVAVLAADAPVQSVLGVVEHVLRRLKNAELHVPFGRGIEQDCRRPNRKRISGEARIEEHIPDVAVDAVVQRVSIERRGVEVVRCAETAKLQPDLVVRELLLQKDLIQERPLSADHLLHGVNAADVLSGQVLSRHDRSR